MAGIVVTNTTVTRPSTLKSPKGVLAEAGGLSGPPLLAQSTHVLSELYRYGSTTLVRPQCGREGRRLTVPKCWDRAGSPVASSR